MKASKFIVSVLVVLASPLALGGGPKTEKEALDYVTSSKGPLASDADYRDLKSVLETEFENLSRAQHTIINDNSASINTFHIIKSEAMDAFVMPLHETGTRLSRNLVFVSTGFLKKMANISPVHLRLLQTKNPALSKEQIVTNELVGGIQKTIGVLAHELAHPLDTVNVYEGREGIDGEYGSRASQAVEIRADVDGMQILRQAGYPQAWLMQALMRTSENQGRDSSFAADGASTHPQDDFRLASSRMFMTLDRLEHGFYKQTDLHFDRAQTPKLMRDLQRVHEFEDARVEWVQPKSFEEAVERLVKMTDRAVLAKSAPNTSQFELLVLSADYELTRILKTRGLNSSEQTSLEEYVRVSMIGTRWNMQVVGIHRMPKPPSELFKTLPSHKKTLETLPLFRSKPYLDLVKKMILQLRPYDKSGLWAATATTAVLPTVEGIRMIGPELLNIADPTSSNPLNEKKAIANETYERLNQVPDSASLFKRDHVLWTLFLLKNHPKKFLNNDLKAVLEGMMMVPWIQESFSPWMTSDQRAATEVLNGVRHLKLFAKRDPEARATLLEVQASVEEIWANRGFFAAIDLLTSNGASRWNEVEEILSGSTSKDRPVRGQIDNQVRAAFLKYIAEGRPGLPAFADLVRMMDGVSVYGNSELQTENKRSRSTWLNARVLEVMQKTANDRGYIESLMRVLGPRVYSNNGTLQHERFIDQTLKAYRGQIVSGVTEISGGAPIEKFSRAVRQALVNVGVTDEAKIPLLDLVKILEKIPADAAERHDVLRDLFLRTSTLPDEVTGHFGTDLHEWTVLEKSDSTLKIADWIIASRAAPTYMEMIKTLKSHPSFLPKSNADDYQTNYYKFTSLMAPRLQLEFAKQPATLQTLTQYLEALYILPITKHDRTYSNSAPLRALRDQLLEVLKKQVMEKTISQGALLEAFIRLTQTGPTEATDLFARDVLLPMIEKAPQALPRLERMLKANLFESGKIRLQYAKVVLEPRILALESKAQITGLEIHRLIEDFHAMAPQGSAEKDAFIEKMAWRLKLDGVFLKAFISDQKSQNWRRADPATVNLASMIGGYIKEMSREKRESFTRYILEPRKNPGGIPREVVDSIKAKILQDIIVEARNNGVAPDYNAMNTLAESKALDMKFRLEAMIRDMGPTEKIPIIEMLISVGDSSYSKQADYPKNITRGFLKDVADSSDEKQKIAYLNVTPSHENAATLAYLIAHSIGDEKDPTKIFELFGTVGKKAGQALAIYPMNPDPAFIKALQGLKDNATPMTKEDIESILQTNLDASDVKKAGKMVKILGSASIKTVVDIKMQDGREAVLMVQSPHGKARTDTNLEIALNLIKELERMGLTNESTLISTFVEALKAQLSDEMDFVSEAKKFATARKIFLSLNSEMKRSLGQWKFDVPAILKDMPLSTGLAFYEKANGVSFEKLSPQLQKELGPLLVEASLRSLFRYGLFDADRHRGNWMIDVKTKTIFGLDFGQLEDFEARHSFRWDPRLTLARLFQGLSNGDATLMADALILMVNEGSRVPSRAEVKKYVEQALRETAGKSKPDQLKNIVQVISANGITLDKRFSFGALKGFFILAGENYSSARHFEETLAREIRLLYLKKLPVLIWGSVRSSLTPSGKPAADPQRAVAPPTTVVRSCERIFG